MNFKRCFEGIKANNYCFCTLVPFLFFFFFNTPLILMGALSHNSGCAAFPLIIILWK